jgi:hypothetical protein
LEKLKRERRFGKLWHRKKDDIKMDLGETGWKFVD